MKKILLSFLLAVFVLLPTVQGECYVSLKNKKVPLSFGTVKMPNALYILEIDLVSLIQVTKNDFDEALLKEAGISEIISNVDWEKNLKDVHFYQVGIDDGQSYKVAFFMTISKDASDYTYILNRYFKDELSVEDKNAVLQKRLEAISIFQNKGLISYENIFNNSEIRNFDLGKMDKKLYIPKIIFADESQPKLDFVQIAGRQAYFLQARTIVDGIGALCSQGYFFSVDKTVNSLIIFSTDSEREFWRDLFYNSLNFSLRS